MWGCADLGIEWPIYDVTTDSDKNVQVALAVPG